MRLLSHKTLWIFLLATSQEAEIRHIYDIAFGVTCLYEKNVNFDNIKLIIDGDNFITRKHLEQFPNFPNGNYDIYSSKDLKNIIQNTHYENIVIFVNGHGNFEQGIDAPQPIKPYNLLAGFISCK